MNWPAISLQWREGYFDNLSGSVTQIPRVLRDPLAHSPPANCTLIFTSVGFLDLDSLKRLPSEDVSFLELKGCLHVPIRSILDDIVRHYFSYIHPSLPVVNEAEFWDMYHQSNQSVAPKSMSLFLFQAILSASCVVSTTANVLLT